MVAIWGSHGGVSHCNSKRILQLPRSRICHRFEDGKFPQVLISNHKQRPEPQMLSAAYFPILFQSDILQCSALKIIFHFAFSSLRTENFLTEWLPEKYHISLFVSINVTWKKFQGQKILFFSIKFKIDQLCCLLPERKGILEFLNLKQGRLLFHQRLNYPQKNV